MGHLWASTVPVKGPVSIIFFPEDFFKPFFQDLLFDQQALVNPKLTASSGGDKWGKPCISLE